MLLYCSKLAVVDHANMRTCLANRINLFNLTNEQTMPFNMLFQKSSRKRQTDVLLDSWRKVTAKRAFSYQFVLKSKELFADLFMCTLQNCIDELGGDFQVKLKQTFEMGLLWPPTLDEDDSTMGKTELVDYEYDMAEEIKPSVTKGTAKRTADGGFKATNKLPAIKMSRSRTTGRRRKIRKDFDFEYDYNLNNGADDEYEDDEQLYTDEDEYTDVADEGDQADEEFGDDAQAQAYEEYEEMLMNEYGENFDDQDDNYQDMDEGDYEIEPNPKRGKAKKTKKNAKKNAEHFYTYDDQFVHQNDYTDSEGQQASEENGVKQVDQKMTMLELIETDADFNQSLRNSIRLQLVDYVADRIMSGFVQVKPACAVPVLDNLTDLKIIVHELLHCLWLTGTKQFTQEFIDLKDQTSGQLNSISRKIFSDLSSNSPICLDGEQENLVGLASVLNEFYSKYEDNSDVDESCEPNVEQQIKSLIKTSGLLFDDLQIVGLHSQLANEPVEFLRKLCGLVFDRNRAMNDNLKRFDFIKTIMFRLYPSRMQATGCDDDSASETTLNWSKCLNIINECF
jgi:hypothetical protein